MTEDFAREADELPEASEIINMQIDDYMEFPIDKLRKFVLVHQQELNQQLGERPNPDSTDLLVISRALEKQGDLTLSLGAKLSARLEVNNSIEALSDAESLYENALDRIESLNDRINSVIDKEGGDVSDIKLLDTLDSLEEIDDLEELIEARRSVLNEFRLEAKKLKSVQSGWAEVARGVPSEAIEYFKDAEEACESQERHCDSEEAKQIIGMVFLSKGFNDIKKRDPGSAANNFSKASSRFPDNPDGQGIDVPMSSLIKDMSKYNYHLCQGIYYEGSRNYDIAIDEFDEALELVENIMDGLENIPEDMPDDLIDANRSVWRGNKSHIVARRLVSEGKSLMSENKYNQAIQKFQSAKSQLDTHADQIAQVDISILPEYDDMIRNYVRETIPNLIEQSKRTQQLYEEKKRIQQDYQDLQNRLLDTAAQLNVEVDNAIQATSIAKASAEAVNQIQPVILENVDELLELLPESELPDEERQKLNTKAMNVKDSVDEPEHFIEKLKKLGHESQSVLGEYSDGIAHGSNIATILQFFAMFA